MNIKTEKEELQKEWIVNSYVVDGCFFN